MDIYQIWTTYNKQWSRYEILAFVGVLILVCIAMAVCVHRKNVFCQQEFLKIRRKIPCFQKRNSLLSEGHYWLFKVSLRGLMALP